MKNEEKACGMNEGINSTNDLQKRTIAKRIEKAGMKCRVIAASDQPNPNGFNRNNIDQIKNL